MFSLQPPRHISTLPDSDLRRCSLSRRYGGIADIKRAAGGLCMVSSGWEVAYSPAAGSELAGQ
jgi:hypothetical protein